MTYQERERDQTKDIQAVHERRKRNEVKLQDDPKVTESFKSPAEQQNRSGHAALTLAHQPKLGAAAAASSSCSCMPVVSDTAEMQLERGKSATHGKLRGLNRSGF